METVKTSAANTGKTLEPKERLPTIIFNHLLFKLDFTGSTVEWVVAISEHEDWSLELESDQDGTFNYCVVYSPVLGANRETYKCALSSEQIAKLKEAADEEHKVCVSEAEPEAEPECTECGGFTERLSRICSNACLKAAML